MPLLSKFTTLYLLSFLTVTSAIYGSPSGPAYPLPTQVKGLSCPILSLSGTWDFKYTPESPWTTLQVPGEAAMQGFAIEHDKPFYYKKVFTLPAGYTGKRIILRFDGVYSQARLSVNGKFIREHHGGFTRWETDITSFLQKGNNEILLEVTDRLDEISYASGYAHHPIGGILRDVTLFALPKEHLYDVCVETHLDSVYKNADLRFACQYTGENKAEVSLVLKDKTGRPVRLSSSRFTLTKGENVFSLPVINPLKWDAEHPNLYQLEAIVYTNGKESYRFARNIGFRDIKIVKDRMLVNGRPVKLRGACRHDIHPILGRTTSAGLDSLDVMLFKQANMNFVRTSHYPPTERFLDYCDRYGIYVESETAVCFVNTHRQKNYAPGSTENNTAYAGRYLGQCQEMVKSFRSHPSVLFWSIGNESVYGSNFQLCWDWVKATDTTRPVIFSYPGSAEKKKARIYDLLSMHYQDVEGNLWQWGMSTHHFEGHGIPVIYDEWAHPACYTYQTLQTDPNIREFWGISIDKMWSGLFEAPGGLGGAIWGYVDEVFALPRPIAGTAFWKEFAHTAKPEKYRGDCVGYGEWGIVDVWRRPKPEFWSTKKAYSPVRLLTGKLLPFTSGQKLMLTVYNRFDHTRLDEIRASYTYKGIKKELRLDAVEPHQKGMMVIPAEAWEEGETLLIEFFTMDGERIDAYRPVLGTERISYPSPLGGQKLSVKENDEKVTVSGEDFEIPFDKRTGLIVNARVKDKIIIEKGPFLNVYVNLNHLTGAEVRKTAHHFTISEADWRKTSFSYTQQEENVYAVLSGTYKNVKVTFTVKINPAGELSIDYQTTGIPNGYLREAGLAFYLPETVQQLKWKRNGYWDYYPEGELAGNEGNIFLYRSEQAAYSKRPNQPWSADTHNYYYWADAGANCQLPLTQTAKGMKENIYYYSLDTRDGHRLSVISPDASVACRINKTAGEQLVLYTNNRWDYPEIAWGNYCKTVEALPCYGRIDLRMK